MTLEIFSRDVVPVITLFLGVLGLVSVVLLWLQIKETTKWNKLQGQAAFLNRPIEQVEARAQEALTPIGIDLRDFHQKLTRAQAEAVLANVEVYYAVKTYLNLYEDLAAGVRIGFVDEDFAYALESARLVIAWRKFAQLAALLREQAGDDEVYIELENVSDKWAERIAIEAAGRAQAASATRKQMGISRPKG